MTVDPRITQVYEAHAKRLSEWMVENGFRSLETHAMARTDTFEDMLSELSWKVAKASKGDIHGV